MTSWKAFSQRKNENKKNRCVFLQIYKLHNVKDILQTRNVSRGEKKQRETCKGLLLVFKRLIEG